MFWSGELLSVQGGKFSQVWLLGLDMDPKSLDKEDRKKLAKKALLALDFMGLLDDFRKYEPQLSLRVTAICSIGLAKILKIQARNLRDCVLRIKLDLFRRAKALKKPAIDVDPNSAKKVTMKEPPKEFDGGVQYGTAEHFELVEKMEESIRQGTLFDDEVNRDDETTGVKENRNAVKDLATITMPDPDLEFHRGFGRLTVEIDDGERFDDFGDAEAANAADDLRQRHAEAVEGLFQEDDLFGEPNDREVTEAQPPPSNAEETAEEAVAKIREAMSRDEPEEVRAPRKRTADDARSDTQTATTEEGGAAAKKQKKDKLTPTPPLFDDVEPVGEETAPLPPTVTVDAPPEGQRVDAEFVDGILELIPTGRDLEEQFDTLDEPLLQADVPAVAAQNIADGPNIQDEVGPPSEGPAVAAAANEASSPISFELGELQSAGPAATPRGRGRGRRGGRGGRGGAGARRGPIIDREIKIPQEQMLERTKGESYRANDCHTSGFDDFEAKRDEAKYGFHHQVVPGKNKKLMLQVTTRAGSKYQSLHRLQQAIIRRLEEAPADWYEFGEVEPEPEPLQQQPEDDIREVENQQPNGEPGAAPDQTSAVAPAGGPTDEGMAVQPPQEGDDSEWLDIPDDETADRSSKIRGSSLTSESDLRDVGGKGKRSSTTTGVGAENRAARDRSRQSRDTMAEDVLHPVAEREAPEQPMEGVAEELPVAGDDNSMIQPNQVAVVAEEPEQPMPVENQEPQVEAALPEVVEERRDDSFRSDEEDPWLTKSEVADKLAAQPMNNQPMNFRALYPPNDAEEGMRRTAALAFQHLLTLEFEDKVRMTQDNANFKDDLFINMV